MDLKFFQLLEMVNTRLGNIEKNISKLDEKIDYSIALQRNHLIRMKHGEFLDDNMILNGRPYNDLTPQKAFEIFQNKDLDYIVVDVCEKNYSAPLKIEGAIRIPYEELSRRYTEIQSKTTPILVISEDGLKSILACELLVKKGFFNLNNISGGYRFYPKESQTSPATP